MKTNKYLAQGGIIAALYVVLTLLSAMMGLSSGAIQLRLSEALCILPCFIPAAVPGLFVGCLLSNLITGCAAMDVIFGSLATLLGALGTYYLRKNPFLSVVPPILCNTLIIPFVLSYAYGIETAIWVLMLGVFIGEFISCGALGQLVFRTLKKHPEILRK